MRNSRNKSERRSGRTEARPTLGATLLALPFLFLWVTSILWETFRPE